MSEPPSYEECQEAPQEAPETAPEAPETVPETAPETAPPNFVFRARNTKSDVGREQEAPPEAGVGGEGEAPPRKKTQAQYEKAPCPDCGRMLSKHWLRLGKHTCARKERSDARSYVVNAPRAKAAPKPKAAPKAPAQEAPPEPKTPDDPILEACRVFQGIQRAARQAKRDRWSSQMLG